MIALAPASSQECADLMIDCFNLAERYRNPVIILMDGEIGHLRERVVLPHPDTVTLEPRAKVTGDEPVFGGRTIPPMQEFGNGGFVHVTGSTHLESGMRDVQTQAVHDRLVRRLVRKIEEARDEIARVDVETEDGAKVGVLAYGGTARPARGAVLRARASGHAVTWIRPITIWPFPARQIADAGRGLERLLVPEMNLGQLAREVERFVDCEVVPVGKIGGEIHTSREIHDEITKALP